MTYPLVNHRQENKNQRECFAPLSRRFSFGMNNTFLRSKVQEISKRVLRTMKNKIESVIEGEMETIAELKYQGATEMFRKI